MPRSLKILKNKLSGSPEALKSRKTSFRDAPKLEKSENQAFGMSRSLKILKNKLSGSPEIRLSLMEIRTIQKGRRVHQNFTF